MPDLNFQVEGVDAVAFAAAPMLAFKLRIAAAADAQIHSVLLRCQFQIEVTRRRYDPREEERLFDLFGHPQDWGRTLRNMQWTEANVSVPGFTGSTLVVDRLDEYKRHTASPTREQALETLLDRAAVVTGMKQ